PPRHTTTTTHYTLSLHDALPILDMGVKNLAVTDDGETFSGERVDACRQRYARIRKTCQRTGTRSARRKLHRTRKKESRFRANEKDRKSTRLNSSHRTISYAVFCL